jgi:hypothetical protein
MSDDYARENHVLTGDWPSRDEVVFLAEWVVANYNYFAYNQDCFATDSLVGWAGIDLVRAYTITHDQRYLDALHNIVDFGEGCRNKGSLYNPDYKQGAQYYYTPAFRQNIYANSYYEKCWGAATIEQFALHYLSSLPSDSKISLLKQWLTDFGKFEYYYCSDWSCGLRPDAIVYSPKDPAQPEDDFKPTQCKWQDENFNVARGILASSVGTEQDPHLKEGLTRVSANVFSQFRNDPKYYSSILTNWRMAGHYCSTEENIGIPNPAGNWPCSVPGIKEGYLPV